ncbi:hypothetical protein ACFPER_02730 [Agromyces aurantiacus]|uniref:Uncharacterized protein n=1 Tax=Agromyces aurantiacus TaxID=165814 RepID=A0ABV9R383_9MICO|nr:hypothetical protein [Agromyces aurantiacus]MBM7506004.1 hypothetical protein [Agromyces aurantiacus]
MHDPTDHAHVHTEDLIAVAITTGGVRVIHLSGVASCPSELWRVEIVPSGPTLPGSARPERLTLGVRGTPPRRRGRTRSARVSFEAIIEDSRTREVEVRLECQPPVVVPVLEANGSFGSSARATRPDARDIQGARPERVMARTDGARPAAPVGARGFAVARTSAV